MAEKESQTASKKLSDFIEKNRKQFVAIVIVLICLLIGYIVATVILNNLKNKNINEIEKISFELTDNGLQLSESEITERSNAALEKLEPYTKKAGIAGARANMLCADITFNQKKYEDSLNYWKATADKAKKSYIAPIAYYNMGVCAEQLNKIEDAAEYYKNASDSEGFVLYAHAKFSYGRVLESLGKYEEAATAYNEVNDKTPSDAWAQVAKTRVIALKAEGKIE